MLCGFSSREPLNRFRANILSCSSVPTWSLLFVKERTSQNYKSGINNRVNASEGLRNSYPCRLASSLQIQINQPTRCNSFTSILLDVWCLNMFRASPRLSSEAYKCISSLWFYRWSVVVAASSDQQRCYHHAPTVKPEAPNAFVSSWW